jgi:hypothetical protein
MIIMTKKIKKEKINLKRPGIVLSEGNKTNRWLAGNQAKWVTNSHQPPFESFYKI